MSQIESSQPFVVTNRPQKELPKNVFFKIFDSLTIDEMFLMSKVCKQWNQFFNDYLQKEFFAKKSLGIRLSMDQLPQIYRQCLNSNESDIQRRWSCADVSHRSGDGKYVQHLEIVSKNMFFDSF